MMKHNRRWNFSAGPAMLPEVVLEQAQSDLLNWREQGASVMELSHRSPAFIELADQCRDKFRQLIKLDNTFELLFLQGGASSQFSLIPMNLAQAGDKAVYETRGMWGNKACTAAAKLIECQSTTNPFDPVSENAAYLHYTSNETIDGTQITRVPETDCPLVCDMSSDILSQQIDMRRFSLIYAGAQKNLGPSGITVVIIRKELLEHSPISLPDIFSYKKQAEKQSMLNTPPCFSWYLVDLVLGWVIDQGGLDEMQLRSEQRSQLLYQYLDQSQLFENRIPDEQRSRMNIVFNLPKQEQEVRFLAKAEAAGLIGLKGHRSVGGIRASLYNAMPLAGVHALLNFMQDFESQLSL